jgi:hypothetical protein
VSRPKEVIPTERIQRCIDPGYLAGIGERPLDELRAMKAECSDLENAISYQRRLAQARMEILQAEHERRASGGTVGDLVKDLPRILSAESARSTITDTRVPPSDTPKFELRWPDGRERLTADTTLAHLPLVPDDELTTTLARLQEFEQELSSLRRTMHAVIDTIEHEIADRQVAGTAG